VRGRRASQRWSCEAGRMARVG